MVSACQDMPLLGWEAVAAVAGLYANLAVAELPAPPMLSAAPAVQAPVGAAAGALAAPRAVLARL
eukprot:1737670-Pyramimonas_sp.AAC.1